MGDFARQFAARNVVGHAAQVFQQHDPQRRRQGPQFAQAQFAAALVGIQEGGEHFRVQHAVGVRHVSPGNAVHTRQSTQRQHGQLGQPGVKTARHAFADLLQLRFDQREVVQQPFGRRCGVVAAVRGQRDVVIGKTQRRQVFFDAWKEGGVAQRLGIGFDNLRPRQAAAVLFKTLNTKQFRPDRRFGGSFLR